MENLTEQQVLHIDVCSWKMPISIIKLLYNFTVAMCVRVKQKIIFLQTTIRDCGSNLYVGMRVVEMF